MLTIGRKFPCAVTVCLGLVLLSGPGCGPGSSEVTGKVTYLNKNLTSGTVMLMASNGKPYYGEIESDGNYTIKNVPPGQAKVSVTCLDPATKAGKASGGKGLGKGAGRIDVKESDPPNKGSLIPLRYGDLTTSKLEVEVTSGVTTFDIKLQD